MLLIADKSRNFNITKVKVSNVQSPQNSLLIWRGGRLTVRELEVSGSQFQSVVGSATTPDSLSHSLVLEDVKITSSECGTCFSVENVNAYEFSLKNRDASLFYYDFLNIADTFLTFKQTPNYAVHSIENVTLSNITPSISSSIVMLYSTKAGAYDIKNLRLYSRPQFDGGQLLQLHSSYPTQFASQGLVLYNVDASANQVRIQPILLSGAYIQATFS